MSKFWHRQECPLFDYVHQAFPLPSMASPTLQGALRYGFGEADVSCDMPESCKFRACNNYITDSSKANPQV